MFRDKALPIVYGGIVFLLSACATAANGGMMSLDEEKGAAQFAGDPRLGEKVDRMCFTSSIDGFSSPTDDTAILSASPSRKYLVETSSCYGLDRAMSIALSSNMSCASRGDNLLVSDSVFRLEQSGGMPPDRCFITAIYEWDEDAAEEIAEATSSE